MTALLFSMLSFARAGLVFYFWLIALTVINGRPSSPNPFLKLLGLQLGRTARWPRPLLAILPLLVTAGLWLSVHPALTHTGVINPSHSALHLVAQAMLVGVALYFTLQFLLPAFLVLHLISSYVYFGSHPFWDFISGTAGRILAPLNRLPLRLSKMDFAPLVGIVLILLLLHTLPNVFLDQLNRRDLTIWPP